MLRVVQPGSGSPRAAVIIYHVKEENDAHFTAALPKDVLIANDTGPSNTGYYERIPSLPATVADLEARVGARLDPVIVAGFSEGGFATRRILDLGGDPDALVIADGTYGVNTKSWRTYVDRAKRGERVFFGSHSSVTFMEPQNPSTWRVMKVVTGFDLPLRQTKITQQGNAVVWSYADEDHRAQGRVALPQLLVAALGMTKHGTIEAMDEGKLGGAKLAFLLFGGVMALTGAFVVASHLLAERDAKREVKRLAGASR